MIAIYRACPTEMTPSEFKRDRPAWFDKKKCFTSFYNSWIINQKPEDIHVIFDGDADCELAVYVKSFTIGQFITITHRNNGLSLLCCYELAAKIDFDYVYFIEDDYIHTKNAISILHNGLSSFPGFMFTLYDHPDRYTRDDDITKNKESILLAAGSHWRTAESTTCTVAMSKNVFYHIHKDMMMFSNGDRAMFRYLLQKYGLRLLQPLPGQATHITTDFYTPLQNWDKIQGE